MRRGERSYWWVKEKKDMALLFFTITMMLRFLVSGCVGCLETERIGLLQLKAYLNSLILGPQDEGILKSWSDSDPKSNCCLWEGVKCSDAIGGHIVDLSASTVLFPEYLLRGGASLSLNLSLLHSFPQLETLDFSSNGFHHLFDPIHGYKSFQRLEKLRTLNLSANDFNNSILPFLSAARSLKTLSLGYNRMEGVFPPNELANMRELRVLDLTANMFTSFSGQGLINFWELEALDLSGNRINDVETCVGLRTTKLTNLDLSDNKFSEAADLKGLEHLVDLKVLRLTDNNFNHTRSIQVLKNMPKLQELDLSSNGFTDLSLVFPSSLGVLNLAKNKLSSTPKVYLKICALMNLRELDLSNNALTNLPYCLGNLSSLRTLELSYNQLNGNLSPFVSGLPSRLEYLSLLQNNFNGSFLFSSLVNHTRLTVFKMSSRVGTIQAKAESSWVPLFQLKSLTLQNFVLGSTIPGFLIHQYDLCYLDLSHNKLAGAIPAWLVENNTRLQTLLLNGNSLTKLQLPSLIHGLQALDISSNEMQDRIQEDIGIVFPKLTYLNFSLNHFHGTIPSSMGEMKSLETLDVSFNDLYGQLPKTFLRSCYSLVVLKLSNNQFQGSLGKGLLNSKNTMTFLDISENRFSGASPYWIGRMSNLFHLNMSRNQLKGTFPRHLQNLPWLMVMDISHNSFSGAIPNKIGFPHLLELRLQSNKFMGSIPDTFFNSATLQVIDLRNNNFSGKIMSTTVKRSNLRVLLLRNNSFQGHIPKNLCQLSEVSIMDLSHNKLKGVIPSCLGSMSFGRHKNPLRTGYDGHSFTFFPRCQYYASHLNNLESNVSDLTPAVAVVDILTKNRYEAYQGDILDNMCDLDLSSNQLSGEIPVEIGNLESIKSLNLSNNYLTSFIPVSFSKLKELGSLDLSNNKLDGSIPPQLADLHRLGVFDVSSNNLSGEIPLNGHLLTFGEMSYIGNPHLCGLPTNKSCNPMPEPSASKPTKEEEEGDGVIDMVWFYWTCGAVYISSLLALSAFLFIDSQWSREWFYRVDLSVHRLQRFKRRFICN